MSSATIRIPTPLRSFTGGADEVAAEGSTVGELLYAAGAAHEGLLGRVLDADGAVRSFVNVYLGSKNVAKLDGLATEVRDGDVLSIVPAVAGGQES